MAGLAWGRGGQKRLMLDLMIVVQLWAEACALTAHGCMGVWSVWCRTA